VIQRPTRSVTRFFIPLIDVLILLFCIFLFMPFMKQPGNAQSSETKKAEPEKMTPEQMKQEIASLRFDLDSARTEIKKLQKERVDPSERLSICVFDIDPKDGSLYHFRDGTPIPVPDRRAAQDVIDEHKRRAGVGKDPFYLIVCPRQVSPYPRKKQIDEYRSWLKEVPYEISNPFTRN
jgi:hypothetical protein